ncbi:MAG: family 16 glycoside hydrolase [Verrucomicrobiota bacterium]
MMKQITFCILVFVTIALVGPAHAEQDQAEQPLRLELDLIDGSRLIGVPSIEAVSVQTPYANMDVPLNRLLTIKMGEDHETASLDLQNGDKLKGVVSLGPIKLATVFGKVSVSIEHIRNIRVMLGGRALPAGDGALAFGGVNWTPWRTLFEVQGDKLVSLPKVRPGFNYGHGGNGRGPALMTNIGSPDWKDYSVEFEYGMRGVDPALNPHGLPLDYRGGFIMFHVASAKESWNERGGSMYNLAFTGDGNWSLTCAYNLYCPTPSGYSNPTSDGSRSLAEGKGLKHDPKAGNKIRIEVAGMRIQIWVDGEKVVDLRDEKMRECVGGQTLDHGGIGVGWGHDSMGWIRNFSAKRL